MEHHLKAGKFPIKTGLATVNPPLRVVLQMLQNPCLEQTVTAFVAEGYDTMPPRRPRLPVAGA